MDDLTDAELDVLLERFDLTDRDLQRRIVGRLMLDRTRLLDACKKFTAVWTSFLKRAEHVNPLNHSGFAGAVDGVCGAVNNVEAGGA